MAAKLRRSDLSFVCEAEVKEFDKLCARLKKERGWSKSDVIRNALNATYGLAWRVPMRLRDEAEIQARSLSRRERRAAGKS